jgi:hypothetical protein
MIHWLWRHSWGLYETHPSRATRSLFNLLDRAHDRWDYLDGADRHRNT